MKCKSRSCRGEDFRQSAYLELQGYCADCESFHPLTEDDLARLEEEDALEYRKRQWSLFLNKNFKIMDQRYYKHYLKPVSGRTRRKNKIAEARKAASTKTQKSAPVKPEEKPKPKAKSKPITSCPDHPNYKVIRAPRSDCPTCRQAYETKYPERVST